MAYKRNFRPPGRPKTKEYVTLMARVPQDLADQVKRYAGLRQMAVSVVLRDALESLVQEDRYYYRPALSAGRATQEIVSDINASHKEDAPEIVSDTNMREEIMSDANSLLNTEALEIVSDTNAVPEIVSDTNGVAAPAPDTHETLSPLDEQRARILAALAESEASPAPRPLDATNVDAISLDPVETPQPAALAGLPYDPEKFSLGKLCPRGHEYGNTGQTLLTIPKRRCQDCENEKKREKRQAAPRA